MSLSFIEKYSYHVKYWVKQKTNILTKHINGYLGNICMRSVSSKSKISSNKDENHINVLIVRWREVFWKKVLYLVSYHFFLNHNEMSDVNW